MSAVKQLNEALNHHHLGAEAEDTFADDHKRLLAGAHPQEWSLKHIDHFAFGLDQLIKRHPDIPELRTAQRLLTHLSGKVYLAREALK